MISWMVDLLLCYCLQLWCRTFGLIDLHLMSIMTESQQPGLQGSISLHNVRSSKCSRERLFYFLQVLIQRDTVHSEIVRGQVNIYYTLHSALMDGTFFLHGQVFNIFPVL